MKLIKLYQVLSETKLKKFLIEQGTTLQNLQLTEIKNEKEDMFGDFIVFKGYKFKKTYGEYQCFETPTEKHKKAVLNFPKAPNDYYKK